MPRSRECGYPNWQAKQNKIRIHRRREFVSDYGVAPIYKEWRFYCPCHPDYGTIPFDTFEEAREYVIAHIMYRHRREYVLARFKKMEMVR